MLAAAMSSSVEELRPTPTPPARAPRESSREEQNVTSIALFTASAPAPGATAEGEAAVERGEARTEDAKNAEGVVASASEVAAATDVSKAAQSAAVDDGDAADQSKIGEGIQMTEAIHTRAMDTEPQVEREATTSSESVQPQAPAAPTEQTGGASLADVLADTLRAGAAVSPAEETEVAVAGGGADTAPSDSGDDQPSSPSTHCEPCPAPPSSHQERSVVHEAPRVQPSTALEQPSPEPWKAASSDDERAQTLPLSAGPEPVASTAFAQEHVAQRAGSADEGEDGDLATDAMKVDQELAGDTPTRPDTPSSSRRRHRPHPWIQQVLSSGAYRLLKPKLANEGFRHARRRSNSRSNSRQQP
jgi:hypothetical protein